MLSKQKKVYPKWSVVAAAALAVLAAAGVASARISEVSSSADWTLKYEMDADPGIQDLDNNLAVDWLRNDTNFVQTILGGKLISASDVGGVPLIGSADHSAYPLNTVWINGANNLDFAHGWTVEASIKLTSSTGPGAFAIAAAPAGTSNGKKRAYVDIAPTSTSWGPKTLDTKDNSDAFHIFRIAQEPGVETLSLWRDTELLCDTLTWNQADLFATGLLIGDITGSQGADYEIDYVRMTSGAYAPFSLPKASQLEKKNSSAFTYRYECDVPVGAEDLDMNAFDDFDYTGSILPTASGNGTVLFDTTLDVSESSYVDGGVSNEATALWPAKNFSLADDGYTIELRVKVTAELTPGDPVLGLGAVPGNEDEAAVLTIGMQGTGFNSGLGLDDSDNSDDFHTFRVVANTSDQGGMYFIYRDGKLLTPEDGICCTPISPGRNALYFGDFSTGSGGAFEVDYIRFMKGTFAPEMIPGDTNGDGQVNADDARTLAANWLTYDTEYTASDGDFNGDGWVNDLDASILAANWSGSSESIGVPEPSTLVGLLGLALGILIVRCRNRK
ncbi:MAG: dockerin type I repeat-containing protein [Pirellulales bacterium]|nr:dockerin type I repeat-containing protein [Pirellulales bacterium]